MLKTDKEQLAITIEQEALLRFVSLDTEGIITISKKISKQLHDLNAPSFIIAMVNNHTLYAESLPNSALDNENWAKRKGNTAMLLGKSSYRATLEMKAKGKDLSNRGLPISEYALSGGAFTIIINNLTIGFWGLSGTTQEEEHQIIVEAIAEYQNKKVPTIFA